MAALQELQARSAAGLPQVVHSERHSCLCAGQARLWHASEQYRSFLHPPQIRGADCPHTLQGHIEDVWAIGVENSLVRKR